MTVLWIVLGVIGAWLVFAVVLALLIGRAARIGEMRHRDAMYLRAAAHDAATRGPSVSSVA